MKHSPFQDLLPFSHKATCCFLMSSGYHEKKSVFCKRIMKNEVVVEERYLGQHGALHIFIKSFQWHGVLAIECEL